MIHALEQHLAAWAGKQLQALSAQSGLFGPVRILAGSLTLPEEPPLQAGEVAVLVKVGALAPRPENQDLNPAPATRDATLRFGAEAALRVVGTTGLLPAADGRLVTPPGVGIHSVDLAAMALLTLLRERPQPGPGGVVPEPAELGARPAGAAAATQGTRRVRLTWNSFTPGSATVTETGDALLRQWNVPLTAECAFALSPAPLEGGRILRVEAATAASSGFVNQEQSLTLYGPAEALSLDWFDGLSQPLLAELAGHDIETFGHLGRLGIAGAAALAGELIAADDAERALLTQLAEAAALRQTAARLPSLLSLKPDALALPARALLAPTEEEALLLMELIPSLGLSNRIATTAVPVAFALRPAQRELVKIGTLLMVGR